MTQHKKSQHYNKDFGIIIVILQILEKVNNFICFKSWREQLMEKGLFVQSIQWSTESYQNELQIIFVLLSKQIIVLRKSFFRSISPTAPQKVSRMQKFSAKISTNGRVVAVGWVWNKLAETFQKIGNGFETLHLAELLWPPIGQRFGKVFLC